jgi:hypothetical protein
MNCAQFETVLCEYLDGMLNAEQRSRVEQHMSVCACCAELARDAAAAAAFLDGVADVEPPEELLTKILFHAPRPPAVGEGRRWSPKKWLGAWLTSLLQPRFAMGMAMTILSFSLVGRVIGLPQRQLTAEDIHPARIVLAIEEKLQRAWDRAVKYYENLRLVYQIQAQLEQWSVQEEEDRRSRAAGSPITPSATAGSTEPPATDQSSDGRKQP